VYTSRPFLAPRGLVVAASHRTVWIGWAVSLCVHALALAWRFEGAAAPQAVLDVVLEPEFLPQVEARGLRLKQGLASLSDRYGDVIGEMRGRGLLTGFQCRIPNDEVMTALRGEKLLTVAASDNVVRLLPPLNISEEEITEALARIEAAVAKLAK